MAQASGMFAVEVQGFDFRYDAGDPVLRDLRFQLPAGVRALLVGANGAGKTTLLKILAGRHLVDENQVRVLGRPAFADTSLVERVSFIGGNFPFDVDVSVDEILNRRSDADPVRRDRLVSVLDVDRRWRMSRVSDGQRRRVQILLGLLYPCELLLLDEVTTDLDVIARTDLLAFLREENEQRGMTIFYATHILDGLDSWATHLALLERGQIASLQHLESIAALTDLRRKNVPSPLLRLVEGWLRRR
jgi:CCR4-NOT complex subunit CAF16